MGGEFWSYSVPYQEDIRAALEALREQEFWAGRFWQPAEVQPGFWGRLIGRGPSKPKRPASIQQALKISDATGTRSILDMERVSETPEPGAVSPLPAEQLRECFGAEHPHRSSLSNPRGSLRGLNGDKAFTSSPTIKANPTGFILPAIRAIDT